MTNESHSFRELRGWAIALFEKERIALFLLKRAKKRAKERFALCRSFGKEQKSESLFFSLLEKSKRAHKGGNRSFFYFFSLSKSNRSLITLFKEKS